MTELLTGLEAPSDAELISRVRGGDVAAYGELFSRHVESARRLGRQLVRGPDVDDLVSEAFAKTLTVLQGGGGPDVAFRAYLLTSVRRLHVDKIRAAKRVQPSEDMTAYDAGLPFEDPAVADFEHGAAAKAFSSLPERWQLVLWHLEVEGQKPADVAPLLGMTPNSVSALAYRAREGLRQAFLTMHLADSPTEQCRWVNEHLGAYVRSGLSRRDTAKVEEHLDGCRRCTAMYLELTEVNHDLAAIIAPVLLGTAAAGYLSSAGGATGVTALLGRARDLVGNGTSGGGSAGGGAAGAGAVSTAGGLVTVGGVVAAGVAVVTAATFVLGGGADREVLTEADRPTEVASPVAPAPAEDRADADVRKTDGTVAAASTSTPFTEPAAEVLAPAPTVGSTPVTEDTSTPDTADAGTSTDSTSHTGTDPATDPGTDAATDPGTAPGTDPGTAPGTGTTPSEDSTEDGAGSPGSGTDPGPTPDTSPPPTSPAEPVALATTDVTVEGPLWNVALTLTGAPDDATVEFSLDGADRARLQGQDSLGGGRYLVTVHLPPGLASERLTLVGKVSVGGELVATVSSRLTLGDDAERGEPSSGRS